MDPRRLIDRLAEIAQAADDDAAELARSQSPEAHARAGAKHRDAETLRDLADAIVPHEGDSTVEHIATKVWR